MTSAVKNDLLDKLDNEPVQKRQRLNNMNNSEDNVCIDLRSLMSYNEISSSTIITSSSIITTSNEIDGGDSGFQEFSSNDSPLSSNSNLSNNSQQETENNNLFSGGTQFSIYDNQNVFKTSNNLDKIFTKNENFDTLVKLNKHENNLNDEDNESVISDISCLSSLSGLDDSDCSQSNFEFLFWVQQQIRSGQSLRKIIDEILPNNSISKKINDVTLWNFIVNLLSEPPKRKKLSAYNNLEDVVNLIKDSKKIIVLTGAGISVSSGIPDFRSKDGIYARLSIDFPDLPDPQAMFDINYFKKDQRPFFKFAKEIYPGQFMPSISHKFIKLIEKSGKLLRNYTQNIDTLEKSANIENVITCHGSFETASCTNCKYKVDSSFIKNEIFAQKIPRCLKCPEDSEEICVMKPDIVFFGEGLPQKFHNSVEIDKNECDLLIVIGSSLKVKPVALIPTSIPPEVPQILINREHLSHMTFDVELLGDCDIIIQELCHRLGSGWNELCVNKKLKEIKDFNYFHDISNMNEVNKRNKNLKLEVGSFPEKNLKDKIKILNQSEDNSYLFVSPSRYFFKGAEIDSESEDEEEEEEKEKMIKKIF